MAIAAIAQAGGQRAVIAHIFVSDLVERRGGHAGLHRGHHQIEHFGGQPARPAHALERFRPMDRNGERRAARGFENMRLRHFGHGTFA